MGANSHFNRQRGSSRACFEVVSTRCAAEPFFLTWNGALLMKQLEVCLSKYTEKFFCIEFVSPGFRYFCTLRSTSQISPFSREYQEWTRAVIFDGRQ